MKIHLIDLKMLYLQINLFAFHNKNIIIYYNLFYIYINIYFGTNTLFRLIYYYLLISILKKSLSVKIVFIIILYI